MKWFKHQSAARNDEKIARLEDKCGLEGYGFYFKMLEIVAEVIDSTDRCEVTYSMSRWGRQTNVTTKKWLFLSSCCADVGLMIVQRCNDDITVNIPNLLKYRDNHTKNLQVTSKQEKEKEIEKERDSTTVVTRDASEQKKQSSGDDKPTQGMQWVEYFVNKQGFQIHEAQTAKTVPMFVHWAELGVTIADVELAIMSATQTLNGKKASNPVYYRRFVEQVMLEKQKNLSNTGQVNNSGSYQQRGQYTPKTAHNIAVSLAWLAEEHA